MDMPEHKTQGMERSDSVRGKEKILLVIVAISMIQSLQFSLSPVLQSIRAYYTDADVSMVQGLVTASSITAVMFALLSGFMVRRITKKQLLIIASLVSFAAGFLPLLADSFPLLYGSRIFFGVAQGLAMALNTAVVADFFEGRARITAMGVQGAAAGGCAMLVMVISGWLGAYGFKISYRVHLFGLLSLLVMITCLPETGVVRAAEGVKARLNSKIFLLALFGFLEFLFLMTFTTNIAMHLSGSLQGDTRVAGILTGIFSGSQILIGLLLPYITGITKRFTIPCAILAYAAGCVFLIWFPASVFPLAVGAVLCGYSQAVFMPSAMVEVSNAVDKSLVALATAVFSSAVFVGETFSPAVSNGISQMLFHTMTTGGVFTASAIGMTCISLLAFFWKRK